MKALWVQVVSVDELEMGDEIQWSWDPALEFQPTFASPVTKGKGKGKLPIPPMLPTDDVVMAASTGSSPGHPTGSEEISGPAMDVDKEEEISTLASAE